VAHDFIFMTFRTL